MTTAVTEHRFAELLARPAVRRLAVASQGISCHIVGGAIRDHVLGCPAKDLDAVVRSEGRSIARRLAIDLPARLVELGTDRFAAYRLVGEGFVLDLWDRQGASLASDLARRDFTVNSCALDVVSGELVDPLGGMADLDSKLLRASSEKAFELDPLRVLRLPRLLARFDGFSVEPETGSLGRRTAAGLAEVAVERIREELELLFAADGFATALPWIVDLRLYPGLWLDEPGLEHPPGRYPAVASRLESFLDRIQKTAPSSFFAGDRSDEELDRLPARQAVAIFALPAVSRSPDEEVSSVERVERLRRGGLLRRPVAAAVRRLLTAPDSLDRETRRRWYLYLLGPLWREGICCRGAVEGKLPTSPDWLGLAAELTRLAEDQGTTIFSPPALLSGNEVSSAVGLEPGPRLGRLLERLRRCQIEGLIRTPAEAREWLRTLRSEPWARRT